MVVCSVTWLNNEIHLRSAVKRSTCQSSWTWSRPKAAKLQTASAALASLLHSLRQRLRNEDVGAANDQGHQARGPAASR